MMMTEMPMLQTVPVDSGRLESYCKRWKIIELAIFGSFARGLEHSDSDIDFLATFAADADWGVFEHVAMQRELEELVGRKVDLLSRRGLEDSENALVRSSILSSLVPVYVSR
jgi:predicted nucleotidyltransferase